MVLFRPVCRLTLARTVVPLSSTVQSQLSASSRVAIGKKIMAVQSDVGANRIKGLEKSVWVEFTGLAKECNAVNVGQGFPDFQTAPGHVTKALAGATLSENILLNQYTRSYGHPRLVTAIAKFYGKLLKHEINPLTDVLVTAGAYNALFYAAFGFLNEGDELYKHRFHLKAIIIEPYYDCYEPQVRMAGAKPVFVPLNMHMPKDRLPTSGDFKLDYHQLESAFSSKTKLLFLNNPNNPLGKVFDRSELEQIAKILRKFPNVIVVSDEVYEWLIYPDNEMIRFATLPDMYERTLTIGSAGKTFSVTGWKLGWVIGPENLLKYLQAVHQNCLYTCPTVTQEACGAGFEVEMERFGTPDCYFNQMPNLLKPKLEQMSGFLQRAGMTPILPQGGYFMMADYSDLHGSFDTGETTDEPKDYRFVRWLCREKKLAAIPPTAFYSKEHKHLGENFVRFCFFKADTTLLTAENIIKEWRQKSSIKSSQ